MGGTCSRCGGALPDGARFCPNCSAPVQPAAASRERKLATVLFADLVGSTALGGSLDPELARDLLERFYDAMAAEIAIGGGTVEKFIGDAVVAVFGAPAAQEDHAERALQVALWMRDRLTELFGDRLALRIGVNTGEVVVGRPREGSSFATGDAVNVTARLEQAAGPGQILVGERTVALVGTAFEFAEPITVQAKGKPEGVPCRVLQRMVAPRRPRGGRGLHTTFVGRDQELSRLEDELEHTTKEGRPRVVTLLGEPGVGKTSLVRGFRERLAGSTRFLLGRCISYGRGVTYSPLADVLRSHLGARQEDPPEAVLARLVGREILGLTLGLDVTGDLDPRAAGQRLREEWTSLLSEIVAEGSLVLAVEDLHWAAAPLVELLDLVLAEVAGPLLVLATTRPAPAALRAEGLTLHLQPLTDEEAGQMADRALGAPLEDRARELVVRHAEGNPFFLEEVLSDLLDRRLLARGNGSWDLQGGAISLGVPDSVQGVLAARIDLLPPPAKRTLQAAAVIGRSFGPAGLTALVGPDAAEVRTLVEHGFVRPTQPELVFKHALTRDVAYASLPKADRARLHGQIAAWLEAEGGGDARAGALAYHYAEAASPSLADLAWGEQPEERARLTRKALHWLRRAAQLAVRRFDLDEALDLLRRGAELDPGDAMWWWSIGRANALRFDGDALWEAMQKAIELTTDDETLAEMYGELAFESSMRGGMWKRHLDPAVIQGWFDRAVELALPRTRAQARALVTKAMWEDDAPLAEEAIGLAEHLDDPELLSYALWARSGAAFAVQDYVAADAWASRRLQLIDRLSDPDKIAHMHYYGAIAALAVGRVEDADRLILRHDEIASRLSSHHEVHALAGLLMVHEALGRWEEMALLQARTERAVAANEGTPCVLNARNLLSCAVAYAELGRAGEARRLEVAATALGFEGYGIWLDALQAHLALFRGDLDHVADLVEGSSATWMVTMDSCLYGGSILLDALVALKRTQQVEEEAAPLLQPGTFLEPVALRALARVRDDPTLAEQAMHRFEAMGMEWHAARTRELARLDAGWT